MPASSGRREGYEVRNCQLSRGSPSVSTSTMRTARTTTPTQVARSPSAAKTASRRRRRRFRSLETRSSRIAVASLVLLAEPPDEPVAQHVQEERQHEERHPHREDRLELEGPGRRVPEAHLDDVGRHRLDGYEGIERKPRA